MLTAHPVLLVAAAAAGLAVALGTVIASAVKAGDEMAGLSEEARKAKQAFQETNRATQEQSESTLSMVSALEAAVAQEEKTAAQKAAILDMWTGSMRPSPACPWHTMSRRTPST